VRFVNGLIHDGHLFAAQGSSATPLIRKAALDAWLDRNGRSPAGLRAQLRAEERQKARGRKAAIAEARAYQRRVHDQAVQESLTRAREALWAIERRKSRERREKFDQLAAIDERAAGRFLIDTEPKTTPPLKTRAPAPQRRSRTRPAIPLAVLKRDASVTVRLAHDQADGLTLQARLAGSVRFRSTVTNTTSVRGEKRNRTIAKLIRSWHLFKKGGDSKGMAEAAEQLAASASPGREPGHPHLRSVRHSRATRAKPLPEASGRAQRRRPRAQGRPAQDQGLRHSPLETGQTSTTRARRLPLHDQAARMRTHRHHSRPAS
jgi:hypothetical protein